MIICHSRGYIFIHLHKTGGTSVEAALEPTLAWNDLLLGSTPFGEACNLHYRHRFGLTKHSSLAEVYSLCTSCPQIETYRVVSVVREPLQRAVSLFNFIASVVAGVPASGVNPPAPPPRRSRGGPRTSGGWPNSWRCKGWAGPFPWFEYHLNQTNHAH